MTVFDVLRPLQLPEIDVPKPVRLRRLARDLARGGGAPPTDQMLARARALFRAALSGGEAVVDSARLCRAVVFLLDEERNAANRERIARLVLDSGYARQRELFVLWQEVRETRTRVALALADALLELRTAGRTMNELPSWIPTAEDASTRRVLLAPHEVCKGFLHSSPRTLRELDRELGVEATSSLGTELLAGALSSAPDRWWSALGAPGEVRTWAKARSGLIQKAVAERQLMSIGRASTNALTLPDEPEAIALTQWVTEFLGDPEDYPARWRDISDEARQVYEWLLVRNEIIKILDAFRKASSKRERADFWAGYAKEIRDARYAEVEGTAVCMIVLRDRLVIEFGDVRNAGYIYDFPPGAPRLRRLRGLPRSVGGFKAWDALVIDGHRFTHFDRIIHTGGWMGTARYKLGDQRPTPRWSRWS